MRKHILIIIGSLYFLLLNHVVTAQSIEIGAQFAMYDPGHFTGYTPANETPNPATLGTFHASAGKTSGVIPAWTAQITINLAAEVIWTGEAFTLPDGWFFDEASSDSQNLTFYNSSDWVNDDPYFMIPVRAVAPRSDLSTVAQTQVMNIGGDWVDGDPSNNFTPTGVTVAENILPVVLTTFNAVAESRLVNLHWSTTMETNSDRFEVERSASGKNWQKIGTVKSHGESNVLRNYPFADTNPINGTNYYRLKMIDKDASFEYSRIVSAVFNGETMTLYPNPAADHFRITQDLHVGSVKITDLTGREISPSQYELEANNLIKVKSMTAGIYLVSVKDVNGLVSIHKLVIGQ